MKRIPLFALLVTAAALPLAAQTLQLSLDNVASKAKSSSDISLPLPMLQMASGFLSKDKSMDPQIQKLIAGLKNITVKKYSFDEEGQYRPEDLQPVRDQLRAAGWGVLIGKHEKGDNTDVWGKSEGGLMTGIAVVKAEPKQVTVIYIEGAIDLVGLAGLAGQFGIPSGLPGQKSQPGQKDQGDKQ
jgi:hypothetical protein